MTQASFSSATTNFHWYYKGGFLCTCHWAIINIDTSDHLCI